MMPTKVSTSTSARASTPETASTPIPAPVPANTATLLRLGESVHMIESGHALSQFYSKQITSQQQVSTHNTDAKQLLKHMATHKYD